jgi:saccharopine dehydrogenase-like NADP-dependent oxidoreductase
MPAILILGAGRSSSALISNLITLSKERHWSVTVGDSLEMAARERTKAGGHALHFDIQDTDSSRRAIAAADVVISMIPAHYHPLVARLCLAESKHLLTASYVSDEMKALSEEAKAKELLFLNECGLDPGIDHMSAMQVIDSVRDKGGEMISFESFTGGLISPETDPENPWRYKFTWNPRNVVMAGQGVARFLQDEESKYIPYQQLFRRTTEISIPGFGKFEGYANRDSLKYRQHYGLQKVKTLLRGTLRYDGYCSAWNVLVQLGCTDDSFEMENVDGMTHRHFMETFLPSGNLSIEEKIARVTGVQQGEEEMRRLKWSGFFDDTRIGLAKGTPAQILEHILNKRWRMHPEDKDLIVMWHRFVFLMDQKEKEIQSSLVVTGDHQHTGMARTVGLPLALAAKLVLEGKIKQRGVVIPTSKEFYAPILAELKTLGISLTETEVR